MDRDKLYEFTQNPHPLYAVLRPRATVHRAVIPPGLQVWVVTDYSECKRVLADHRTFSSDSVRLREAVLTQTGDSSVDEAPLTAVDQHMMLLRDPPEHTRLRRIVGKAFTRRVHGFKPVIASAVDGLVENMRDRDEAELIEDFAFPLAARLISSLSGVDPEDHEIFSGWLKDLQTANNDGLLNLTDYINNKVRGDNGGLADGLLSDLCRASDADEILTHDELVSTGVLLAIAGAETTTGFIGSAVLTLLTWPEQLDLLRSRPDLAPKAVEELLRYEGPVNMGTFRVTTATVEIGGSSIPSGEIVLVSSVSANRDESKFPDGSTFDVTRSARGHLAFGHGIHVCLAAPFVRATAAIAIRRIFEAFPDMRLQASVHELKWQETVLLRGLEALPVQLRR